MLWTQLLRGNGKKSGSLHTKAARYMPIQDHQSISAIPFPLDDETEEDDFRMFYVAEERPAVFINEESHLLS